ncbi:hypothetical protein CDIK_0569 [Cucumispora dikerogammari]|nr:hypothetical protein CDIK_0569 [Cucumispora dikerogammari]
MLYYMSLITKISFYLENVRSCKKQRIRKNPFISSGPELYLSNKKQQSNYLNQDIVTADIKFEVSFGPDFFLKDFNLNTLVKEDELKAESFPIEKDAEGNTKYSYRKGQGVQCNIKKRLVLELNHADNILTVIITRLNSEDENPLIKYLKNNPERGICFRFRLGGKTDSGEVLCKYFLTDLMFFQEETQKFCLFDKKDSYIEPLSKIIEEEIFIGDSSFLQESSHRNRTGLEPAHAFKTKNNVLPNTSSLVNSNHTTTKTIPKSKSINTRAESRKLTKYQWLYLFLGVLFGVFIIIIIVLLLLKKTKIIKRRQ